VAGSENVHQACANPSGRGADGALEPAAPERGDLVPLSPWRKSSYSGYNGSCVEVAHLRDAGIGVRDSKSLGDGYLAFGADVWDAFLRGVKNGEFTVAS